MATKIYWGNSEIGGTQLYQHNIRIVSNLNTDFYRFTVTITLVDTHSETYTRQTFANVYKEKRMGSVFLRRDGARGDVVRSRDNVTKYIINGWTLDISSNFALIAFNLSTGETWSIYNSSILSDDYWSEFEDTVIPL